MARQKTRSLGLIVSLLLFPVTIYYLSPVLIINAGLEGIINGSFIVFASLFFSGVFFGRLFCAYICPAGGLQECVSHINDKAPKQGRRNLIKYMIWSAMIAATIISFVLKGRVLGIDFFYQTDHGISVSNIYAYIIYYGIVLLILLPSLIAGKRSFCHYLCWMAPFIIFGDKLGGALRLPGLVISLESTKCVSCKRCNSVCSMSVAPMATTKNGYVNSAECIKCSACVDACPQKALRCVIERRG